MRNKATHVYSDFNDPDARPALVLTDAALLEINSDDAPVLTLTAEAQTIIQGQTILDALNAFDWRPGELAKDFQVAKEAYSAVMVEQDHDAFMRAQDDFNHACRQLFFGLHTMIRTTVKA